MKSLCTTCKDKVACDAHRRCYGYPNYRVTECIGYEPKTEPTISKMEQVDKDINVRSKDEPQICDTCRYYNSNIPCGSTPSACKEADKFAEEFVDGLKKLKPKDEPQTDCYMCKWLDRNLMEIQHELFDLKCRIEQLECKESE